MELNATITGDSLLSPLCEEIKNSAFDTWISISSTLVYISTAYFILTQSQRLYRLQKYSLRIPDWEKNEKRVVYLVKICLLAVLLIQFGLQLQCALAEGDLTGLPSKGRMSIWISILVVVPFMIFQTYLEHNFKFSMETTKLLKLKSEIVHLSVLSVNEVTSTVHLIVNATNHESNLIWANLALCAFRLATLTTLIYFCLRPVKDAPEKLCSESDSSSEENKKELSPLAIVKQFYDFKIFLIPVEFLAKVSFFLFLCFIGLDAVVDLYTSILHRRILDSLHFTDETPNLSEQNATDVDASPISPRVGSIKLEYRWDYLIMYAVLKFSQYNVVGHIKYYLKKHIETSCCTRLQMDLFSKLHKLSLRWHLENKSVEVFSIMTSAPTILKEMLYCLYWTIPQCLIMVVQFVYLFSSYNYRLSGIVLCTAIVSVILDICLLTLRNKTLFELSDAQKQARSARADSFTNFETVKYFTNDAHEKEKYKKSYLEEQHQYIKSTAWYDFSTSLRELIQGAAELGIILIVVRGIINEEGLTAGDYIYFSGLFIKIMNPVEAVMDFYKKLQENSLELGKIMDVLSITPEIVDEPDAQPLEIAASGGSIEFRNVDFSYTPDRQILSNLNFFVPAGKTVAFVGHSGSGKSTIAKLLFRFYDTTAGEILIDGQNIRKVQCESLRKLIGVVPQDIVLFDDTVKENIRYGDIVNATQEDVVTAAKMASLHNRIESFPAKYETQVGSRGLKLSGGEKQRIAISRTIVKNPPIVILDEATSSLDTETEREIQSSLKRLCRSRTSIIIAHRLSTIVDADMIVVLNDGKVLETGTHAQLMILNGAYAKMWDQQFTTLDENVNNMDSPKVPVLNPTSNETIMQFEFENVDNSDYSTIPAS